MTYRMGCDICDSAVAYSPSQGGTNLTTMKITGLKPNTNYGFTIYAENGVSEMSQDVRYERVSVSTAESAPGKFFKVLTKS